VHKNTVMAAVRKPDGVGGRSEVVREFSTFTADLVRLGEWLAVERVSQVVMEATGVYWRPVWHVLEARGGHELMLGQRASREELAGP
jgi:transposase